MESVNFVLNAVNSQSSVESEWKNLRRIIKEHSEVIHNLAQITEEKGQTHLLKVIAALNIEKNGFGAILLLSFQADHFNDSLISSFYSVVNQIVTLASSEHIKETFHECKLFILF